MNTLRSSFAVLSGAALITFMLACVSTQAETVKVLREDVVTRFSAANNGATPMWCYGAPLIAHDGDDVYVSVIETGAGVPPLCNTRWQIWKKSDTSWQLIATESEYKQREPCPLVLLPGRQLFLSANPSLTKPGTRYRACLPTVFRMVDGERMIRTESPRWSAAANFNDHSYRGIAADRERGELLLLNIDTKTGEQYVSQRDARGRWEPRGKIVFPIRSAYPQVALRNGAAHVMAIGDIREPNKAWQQLKREVLKKEWDYVFRRLFYTSTPDISRFQFSPPVEIDSVEETAGHIANLDLFVDAGGNAHLLYLRKPHQHAFLRDRYFPGQPITSELVYAIVARNQVVTKEVLLATDSNDGATREPTFARFHVGPKERLYVVYATKENRLMANWLLPLSRRSEATPIMLDWPFQRFFTSTPRGGSEFSDEIHLFGTSDDIPNLRYAAVRVQR